jgi:acyl carrier protein
MYRTGDRARYSASGEIEFLGRIDDQVKIRGFRIEPGEIETVLRQHVAVREAVVVAREDPPQEPASDENPKSKIENLKFDKRLVAYVVLEQEKVSNAGDLREYLKARLPQYMIPHGFAFLDALPLTPSGKIDRRSLPLADRVDRQQPDDYVAPRTETERVLTGIWSQVIGVERVGIRDDFFELGGHSLLATRLISRIREAFEVELSLRILFESPTVEELAAVVDERRVRRGDS